MEVVYRCCCGIDVHKNLIVACLRKGGRQELREFGTMTSEIKALANWLTEAGCDERRALPFHQMLLKGELPLTIGGGIGQSRLAMLMIGCAHIGEVQSSVWDQATVDACEKAGIRLL